MVLLVAKRLPYNISQNKKATSILRMTAAVTKPLRALHKYQTVGIIIAYAIGHAHTQSQDLYHMQECLCVNGINGLGS